MPTHLMLLGGPACGFTRSHPRDWPQGHDRVVPDDALAVDCADCRASEPYKVVASASERIPKPVAVCYEAACDRTPCSSLSACKQAGKSDSWCLNAKHIRGVLFK
jgi:hypothetical protein